VKAIIIEVGVLFLLPYIVAVIHFMFAINALRCAFGIPIASVSCRILVVVFSAQVVYFMIIRKNYLLEIKRSL